MKLSIVMPVYNTKNSELQSCVESVLEQTSADWNLIIVDDGSTPETASLCDRIAQSDRRISVIHQKNAGAGAARNTGTQYADGEYVAYIDSDDVLSRYMVEEVLQTIHETDADIVYGMAYKSGDADKALGVINSPSRRTFVFSDKETVMRYLIFGKLREYHNIETPGYFTRGPFAKAVKSEIARNVAFSAYKLGEDVIWNFGLLPLCEKLVINWNAWYGYVARMESAITKYYGNRREMVEDYIETLRGEAPDFFSKRPAMFGKVLAGEFYCVAKFDFAAPERKLTPSQKNRTLREILKSPPWNLLTRREYRKELSIIQKTFILLCRMGLGFSFLSLYLYIRSLCRRTADIFKRRNRNGDA